MFAKDIDASAHLTFPLDSLRGTAHLRVTGLAMGGVRLDSVSATADIRSPGHAVAELNAELSSGPAANAHADVAWSGDTTDVRLDRLRVAANGNDWALLSPSRITRAGAAWTVDSLVVVGRTAGRMSLRGSMPDLAEMAAEFEATDLPLADLGELAQVKSPLSGSVRIAANLSGTRDAPIMLLDASVRDALVAGVHLERADATGRYAERSVEATVSAIRQAVTALRVDATIPVDLRFRSVRQRLLADAPLKVTVHSDSVGVALLELLSPEVTKAHGALALNATISGTGKRPLVNGSLRITNGGFDLPALGTKWSNVEADIGFLGDSIALRNVTAASGETRGANATLSGWLGFRDMDDPTFDLRLNAQNFNAINKARVADLDLSGNLRVAGATSGSTLTGAMTVERGTVFIPDIFTKELISLDDPELRNIVDTVALADHGILPRAPSRVVENLFVNDVPVTMGRDVNIRSSEANITLGGSVSITRGRVLRGNNAGRYQLALDGTLQTVRGSYRLNAGPVQRTFDVEGGEIRFRGDPDPNLAEMDIRALHTVRTFSQSTARQDVRVRVNIGGTLGSPRATFSTPDSSRVSDSDILSYLVTGGPSNEILGRSGGDVSTTAYRVAPVVARQRHRQQVVGRPLRRRAAQHGQPRSVQPGHQGRGEQPAERLAGQLCQAAWRAGLLPHRRRAVQHRATHGAGRVIQPVRRAGLQVRLSLQPRRDGVGGHGPVHQCCAVHARCRGARLRPHAATIRPRPLPGLAVLTFRTALIVNPVARRTAGTEPSVLRAFRAAGVALTVEHTRAAGDGVRLARELAATHDRLFVLGGDGTVTEVATGLAEARSSAAIGILPSGTGNQLARALSVPLNPSRAVGALLAGEVRHLDLAILNGHRRVGIGAGVGLDAAMIAGARGRLKQILGVSSYVVSVARAAMRPRRFTVRAEVDGRVIEREGAVAMVLNLGRIFNGMLELAPGASLTDGVLDLVIVDAHGLGDAAGLLRGRDAPAAPPGRSTLDLCPRARDQHRGERRLNPCQVDGDLVDDRRLSLVVAPGERGLLAPLGARII